MKVEVRADSVLIEGYVNAVERDSKVLTDENGHQFVEQIMAGCFERALDKAECVGIMLNHDYGRCLGDTKNNLELYEDAIGLHARAIITDPEVIEYGKNKELKGWSFGFSKPSFTTEELANGLYRRRVSDLELIEVSIIAGNYTPVYNGTLAEVRAEKDIQHGETLETRAEYNMVETPKEPIDYSKYHERIEALERGKKWAI